LADEWNDHRPCQPLLDAFRITIAIFLAAGFVASHTQRWSFTASQYSQQLAKDAR